MISFLRWCIHYYTHCNPLIHYSLNLESKSKLELYSLLLLDFAPSLKSSSETLASKLRTTFIDTIRYDELSQV